MLNDSSQVHWPLTLSLFFFLTSNDALAALAGATPLSAEQSFFYMSRIMIKPTKWLVRPAKAQISLGIRPVWSESSLSAWCKLGPLATHWAHSKDSDQTGRMPRLIWVFAGRPPSLIRVFAVRMMKAWTLSYPLSTQQRLWSDWADAQADLSLRWAHMSGCWFCHVAAHISVICGEPSIRNGRANIHVASDGIQAIYSCNQHYQLTGGDSTRSCQSVGFWDGQQPHCACMFHFYLLCECFRTDFFRWLSERIYSVKQTSDKHKRFYTKQ